jgi:hypothetical protein
MNQISESQKFAFWGYVIDLIGRDCFEDAYERVVDPPAAWLVVSSSQFVVHQSGI